jgi:hypothetical protein
MKNRLKELLTSRKTKDLVVSQYLKNLREATKSSAINCKQEPEHDDKKDADTGGPPRR